jgi:Fe-S cluster assembly protein SufD
LGEGNIDASGEGLMASALVESSLKPDLLRLPRPDGWGDLRARAEAQLQDQEWPRTRDEDWKYLDLRTLADLEFEPSSRAEMDIQGFILPEAKGTRLVFVNGSFDEHHSSVTGLPAGVRFMHLRQCSELACALGTITAPEASDFFTNLNTARFKEGALVLVPKGVTVETALHVVFLTKAGPGKTIVTLPRLLVVLEDGSDLILVEEHAGEGRYLSAPVVEVIVHPGARLRHERIQRESTEAFHLASLGARVERGGRYESRTVTLGAALSRQAPRVLLADEEAELQLDGLALLGGIQVADTHSLIDHGHPRCSSRQLHKCIADDRGRAIFNGRIVVRPGAQQTDAQQQSRNLLLSESARIDTKPQLEIHADDVKCAHGAAVGQLDPEEVFYLQSRGLNPTLARNLLTYGFASDLLGRLAVPSLRRQLRLAVLARTQAGADLEGLG